MKNKKVFLLAFFVIGLLLTFGSQKTHAASCVTPEVCKTVPYNASTNEFTEPDGFTCESRGACPSNPYQVCCKPSGDKAATSTSATTPVTPTTPTSFINPLRFDNVEQFLTGIMSAIQAIVVVLALVFILIGSVMILTSAGESGMVEKGKKAITMALVGFAIAIAAPSLLKQLSIIIGWDKGATGAGLTFTQIAMNVLNFLLGTMGIVALVMMVIGAIMYLTSAGDDDRIEKGKEIFKYSMIGVLMAMVSMVLLTQIAKFFQ